MHPPALLSLLPLLLTSLVLGSPFAAASPLSSSSSSPSFLSPRAASSCPSIHVIVARGSTESQTSGNGEGKMGYVATKLRQAYEQQVGKSIDSVGVIYPAAAPGSSGYAASVANGTAAVKSMIRQYVSDCPDASTSNLVLLGYSQGGQITTTALDDASGISAAEKARVQAVVTYGDPTNVPGQSFDRGTATKAGIFERSQAENTKLQGYKDLLVQYCDYNDPYCASGNNATVHGQYFAKYTDDAVNFVLGRIGGTS